MKLATIVILSAAEPATRACGCDAEPNALLTGLLLVIWVVSAIVGYRLAGGRACR